MSKSQKNQTFVLKINTGMMAKHNWNLSVDLRDIRKCNQLVVSLGSSQVLRWLDEINNNLDGDKRASLIKHQIKDLKNKEVTAENKKKISDLYNSLYEIQFQPDYMMLVMDKVKDYKYACKNGFTISIKYGSAVKTIKYRRFLGTAGSIKKSTIIFVNENVYDELMKRINNGRYTGPVDEEKIKEHNGMPLNYKFIPAKLNAYFALQCSASIAVTWPRIIVVDDAITKFTEKVRIVQNSGNFRNQDWPDVSAPQDIEIENNVSDGMGFITPEMSSIWANELNEGDEPLSGFNTRCSFLKGMVFTIPFKQFAEEVAGTYYIKDAWGDIKDVRDADVILTTSMLKLWNSYDGIEDYIYNCVDNHYEFCVAKTSPRELRKVHTTNYQYLQDFDLTDDDVKDLVSPTIETIKECLGMDWKKLILYMCGTGLDDNNVESCDAISKSILACHDLIKDPYIRNKISRMIQKRIKDAKIGVLNVKGDYAIVGNDPYSLLQHMFGIPITGLLKRGECFHRYWSDQNVDTVVMFRAPMTTHENVCKLKVSTSNEMEKWFRYNKTCCFLNSWDTTPIRLNGCDYDSDTVFTTNNSVLVRTFKYKPTLMCVQQSSAKKVPTEKDYITSDINGFGDSIGSVTNKATNMISLRDSFDVNSREYEELSYRISTMMNFQQNAIDRIKGVVAVPVPNEWLNPRLFKESENDSLDTLNNKRVYRNIAAEIKPWFFIYRYSALMTEYNKYQKSVEKNCKLRFRKSLQELYAQDVRTEEEEYFLSNYEKYMPISRAPGTMNRICWEIEKAFENTNVLPEVNFNPSILKSEDSYSDQEFEEIKKVYSEYIISLKLFGKRYAQNDVSKEDRMIFINNLNEEFKVECFKICNNKKVLANILIDLCYSLETTKSFVWEIVGDVIYNNLLQKNGGFLEYPSKDSNGEIIYMGKRYSLKVKEVDLV